METMVQHLNPKTVTIYEKDKKIRKKPLIIAEILAYDQFAEDLIQLIQMYQTSNSICGYAAIANIRILQEYGLVEGLKLLPVLKFRYIEEVMQYIQCARRAYCDKNLPENEHKQYMTDWVANYEISDYIRDMDIYFIRNVAYEFPEALEKVKNEELERLPEEKPFIGEHYFVYHKGKLIHRNDFSIEGTQYFIIDLLGHFIAAVIYHEYGKRIVALIDTMDSKPKTRKCLPEFLNI